MKVSAQTDVTGIVVDNSSNEPLTGASVVAKGPDGKIRKYATSKDGGKFSLHMSSIAGCRLDVSMMGFERKTIPLDSVSFPLTVELEPGTTLLKEVAVKADRIREQGDTISYAVGSFAQAQDRSIGDVLKRMPGINVESSGKIQYQGEDINKFYIEGSDLLGGKYGIATNGISHEDVGAVEVMENHQPMQVLSGIAFSDKAAINLKLKNKAKAKWTFHGDVGGGYSQQPQGALWDGELFVMAVMPNFQNITTLISNNIGEDLSSQATDFFASSRGSGISPYVRISLPDVPSLSQKRTLFNRSVMASTNGLWKIGQGELKSQIDYSFNRLASDASNVTTYFLGNENRIITENRAGVDRSHSLSANFIYELNQKTAFINNTLKTNLDWKDVRLAVTGSLPNEQSASLPDYFVSNEFKLIKRFQDKHLVTFRSINQWESLPQTLSVAIADDIMRQYISDHAFYTNESAQYSFTLKGITVSLEGGLKGYFRSMKATLADLPPDFTGTDYFTLYATPKFEYWIKKVNFSFDAPLSFTRYSFKNALPSRSEFYFSPSLSVNWKPNNRFSVGVQGDLGRSPMNLNSIYSGIIMTDYRSFRRGIEDFHNLSSQNIFADISYKHTRRGVFANASVMQSWSSIPYTLSQQLFGDYVASSFASAKSRSKMLMTNANFGKTLDFMRGSANLNGSFCRNDSHLFFENNAVNSVDISWSVGTKLSGTPLQWLSFDYRFDFASTRLSMNGDNASWLGSMENELLLNIMPQKRWEWHISGEHYHNEISDNYFKNILLLDTKLIFKVNKRFELSASLTNIFNHRTYSYIIYDKINSFESRRSLRGRELLISISLRK